MYAYVNDTTFEINNIENINGDFGVVLSGNAALIDKLRDAGCTELGIDGLGFTAIITQGHSVPIIIDAVEGAIPAYIQFFADNAVVCHARLDPASGVFPVWAPQTNVPCRIQLHAHTYKRLSQGAGPARDLPFVSVVLNLNATEHDNTTLVFGVPSNVYITNFGDESFSCFLLFSAPCVIANSSADTVTVYNAGTLQATDTELAVSGLVQLIYADGKGLLIPVEPVGGLLYSPSP